ncbi:MAG: hypothetical protein ACLU6Y_14300 [Ruminococcus sp.]
MLDYDGAAKILEFAKEGLPVVIVGSKTASKTPFNDGKDDQLKALMDEMKALPNVKTANILDNEVEIDEDATGNLFDEVYAKLHDELGIRPYAEFEDRFTASPQIHVKMAKSLSVCLQLLRRNLS